MSRQIWLINGALAVLLVWGTLRVIEGWKAFEAGHQISELQGKPDTSSAATPAPVSTDSAVPAEAWFEIASRNPFSFDRNEIDLVEAKPPVVLAPKPVLFGTLVLGNDRLALMGKAGAATRSGPPVKVGETFDGWKVVRIEDKSVVVTAGGAEESLVVGRVPIVRNTEKTSAATAAVPAAAPSVSVPATAAPAPAAAPASPAISSWRPGMPAPPGTRVSKNPFGEVLVTDEK
jgi:hypothetical protein